MLSTLPVRLVQRFADSVKKKTNGRIVIETHFSGELGDERSTIEQCQFGGLDFTRVSSGAAAEFAPLMNAMQMPYLYKDVDHLFKVMDGEIGQRVFKTFEDNNFGRNYLSSSGFQKFFQCKERNTHTQGYGRYEDSCFRIRSNAEFDEKFRCRRSGTAI